MASTETSARRYAGEHLIGFMSEVLELHGMPKPDAELGATILVDADLAGVDTHGIANFATHDHYVKGLRSGVVDPRAQVAVLRDGPTAAAWDSGAGFGPVIAHRAMTAAIAKADVSGVGMVTVRNARHFGANGYFAELAARQGLIAMVTANTPVAGIPPGATRPVVGPNPFAFAAPRGDETPLVLDISMTAAAGGKVIRARAAGDRVPMGWVVDRDGNPTTDPDASRNGGGLELLGGEIAGHKGFALALMVDTLGILAGNGSGLWQSGLVDSTWTQGQWFAAWRPDLFLERAEFEHEMRRLAEYLHGVSTRDGKGLHLPGERRASVRAERGAHGVPLTDTVLAPLVRLAEETGVTFPSPVEHP